MSFVKDYKWHIAAFSLALFMYAMVWVRYPYDNDWATFLSLFRTGQ